MPANYQTIEDTRAELKARVEGAAAPAEQTPAGPEPGEVLIPYYVER